MCGGFGMCGVPSSLIQALTKRTDLKDFTLISDGAGFDPDGGVGVLLRTKQVSVFSLSDSRSKSLLLHILDITRNVQGST